MVWTLCVCIARSIAWLGALVLAVCCLVMGVSTLAFLNLADCLSSSYALRQWYQRSKKTRSGKCMNSGIALDEASVSRKGTDDLREMEDDQRLIAEALEALVDDQECEDEPKEVGEEQMDIFVYNGLMRDKYGNSPAAIFVWPRSKKEHLAQLAGHECKCPICTGYAEEMATYRGKGLCCTTTSSARHDAWPKAR